MYSETEAALLAWSECHPDGVTLLEARLPLLLPGIAVRVPGALDSPENARRLNGFFNSRPLHDNLPPPFLQMLKPHLGLVYFLHFWRAFTDVSRLVVTSKRGSPRKTPVIILELEQVRDQLLLQLVEDHVCAKALVDAVNATAATSAEHGFWSAVKASVTDLDDEDRNLDIEELSRRMISWLRDVAAWQPQGKENQPANSQPRRSVNRLSARLSSWKRTGKGKASLLSGEPSNTSQDSGMLVCLHVYDVSLEEGIQKLNKVLANKLSPVKLGGVFHAGVEVNGLEWSYGFSTSETMPGISCEEPKQHPHHHYRQTITLRRTNIKAEDIADIISNLIEDYPGDDYDLLRRNCCHFADDFCQRLGVGRIPRWVHRLARLGASLDGAFQIAHGLHTKFRGVLVPADHELEDDDEDDEEAERQLRSYREYASRVSSTASHR